MNVPLTLESAAIVTPRAYYENLVYEMLSVVWRRKWFVAAFMTVALTLALVAIMLSSARYTGEAIVQLNFTREDPATGAKSHSIATVDATAVVDSAARLIRSRATASAVVDWLGLDRDPAFTRESFLSRTFSELRSVAGLAHAPPPKHDVAVAALMRRLTVSNEPRSYLITVAVTTSDPEQASRLANAVALEYLRGELLQQLTDTYAGIEREVAELSSVYGRRHPQYLNGRARLERLEADLTRLREGPPSEDVVRLVAGQSLVPAKMVMVPSGPRIVPIVALTVGAALILGGWLAVLLERGLVGGIDRARAPLEAIKRFCTSLVMAFRRTAAHGITARLRAMTRFFASLVMLTKLRLLARRHQIAACIGATKLSCANWIARARAAGAAGRSMADNSTIVEQTLSSRTGV